MQDFNRRSPYGMFSNIGRYFPQSRRGGGMNIFNETQRSPALQIMYKKRRDTARMASFMNRKDSQNLPFFFVDNETVISMSFNSQTRSLKTNKRNKIAVSMLSTDNEYKENLIAELTSENKVLVQKSNIQCKIIEKLREDEKKIDSANTCKNGCVTFEYNTLVQRWNKANEVINYISDILEEATPFMEDPYSEDAYIDHRGTLYETIETTEQSIWRLQREMGMIQPESVEPDKEGNNIKHQSSQNQRSDNCVNVCTSDLTNHRNDSKTESLKPGQKLTALTREHMEAIQLLFKN